MNCFIVVGSQREGNSLRIGKKIKKLFENKSVNTYLVIPGKQNIKLCTGCLKCDETHRCIFKDDMAHNLELFNQSEYIVFITPSRFSLLSSDMKVFMDRLCPLCLTCDFKSKKFIAISLGQTQEQDKMVDSSLNSLIEFSDNCEMPTVFKYKFYDCYGDSDLKEKEIEEMCHKLEKVLEE